MSVIKPFPKGYSGMPSQANNGKQRYMRELLQFLKGYKLHLKNKIQAFHLEMYNFLNFQLASYLQAGRKKCNIGKKKKKNSLELAGNDVFLAL